MAIFTTVADTVLGILLLTVGLVLLSYVVKWFFDDGSPNIF